MTTHAEQFHADAQRMAGDLRHRSLIQVALEQIRYSPRPIERRCSRTGKPRDGAAAIKWEAVNHLDQYLARVRAQVPRTDVHWASTAQQARESSSTSSARTAPARSSNRR